MQIKKDNLIADKKALEQQQASIQGALNYINQLLVFVDAPEPQNAGMSMEDLAGALGAESVEVVDEPPKET